MRFIVLFLCASLLLVNCSKEENEIPVANAGPSVTITLPNPVTLTGSGSDADGSVVAYLWSQVSGPNQTNIINPGSATTVINGFALGNYVFQLMVTDNSGATGVDTVAVTVNPGVAQTLTFQPANNPEEKMFMLIGGQDWSTQGGNEWIIDAWSVGSGAFTGRVAFKFDMSAIPSTATIVSANLYLYSNTPPENGNLIDANFGANNGLILSRISSNWSPASATWTNQPSTSTSDQILLPASTQSVQNLNIDVKNLVGTMVNTSSNYGFFLRLQNETAYKSRAFVSSYNAAKPLLRPKLVVTFQ